MRNLLQYSAETIAVALVFLCGGLLFGALIMEHVFDMAPCPLCLMQRIWLFVAGALTYASVLHNPRWGIYPLLSIVAAGIGGGFSIRQLYLQSLPADQVPACGPDLAYMLDAFPLSQILVAMTRGTGTCAEVGWSFLGLTLPGWALLGFIVIIAAAILQLRAGAR
ncbi:MAG: disulfide bond formation protein B [Gammaproteobacteria bacterium]|nr:disulfide bond formation protein B [Gammaproteobacteria bacterium]